MQICKRKLRGVDSLIVEKINQILTDTAYVKTAGTEAELRCAKYLQQKCAELGIDSRLESFLVGYADVHEEVLVADGRQIPCKAYLCCGDTDIEAPLYHLTNTEPQSFRQCRGKIVLCDMRVDRWVFQDLIEYGALGYITFCGEINNSDWEIDCRWLRDKISRGKPLPGVIIHVKDAVRMIRENTARVSMRIRQTAQKLDSHNVIVDLPGEYDEWIILSAHYDTVSRSVGSYDNMSGCIGLLGIMENFINKPHRYGLRFIFCGAEELGLMGSLAYCEAHRDEIKNFVLNINLDLLGSAMGTLVADCTAEDRLVYYLQYMAGETGFDVMPKAGVHSSDSSSFADAGVPSVTFARQAPKGAATIHDCYDTAELLHAGQIMSDIEFLTQFTERMACAVHCPIKREIPEHLREGVEILLEKKRK